MSRWIWGPAAVVLAIGAVLFAVALTRERDVVASTPSPRAVFQLTPVEVPAGSQLCLTGVTIPRDARRLRMQVRTFGRSGPALALTLRGRGYAQAVQVPPGYRDETV